MTANNNLLIINSLGLPQMNNIFDLSKRTRLSARLLFCLSMQTEFYYKSIKILKRNGTYRTINSPTYTLYIVQKWILKNILNNIQPSSRAMGYRKGTEYGCKANARYHIGTLYGVSIDLENFFPSIGAEKIYTIFNQLGYNSLMSTILTNLCTLDNKLPQGAVCSPALSNLVCRTLDNRLVGLCDKRGIRYTRYADDMYFSCDNKDLLHKIYPIVKKIIENEGYKINEKKIHFHTPSNKKQITGITVVDLETSRESILKAKREMKKEIRTGIHKSIITGDYSNQARIRGLVSYVNYIESAVDNKYLIKIKEYIRECINKVDYLKELVVEYNSNKYYNDMQDVKHNSINWGYLAQEEIDEYISMFESRQYYFEKNSIVDICEYEDWPNFILSAKSCQTTEQYSLFDELIFN